MRAFFIAAVSGWILAASHGWSEEKVICHRERPRAFVGGLDVRTIPTFRQAQDTASSRDGTYVLRVRSVDGNAVQARLEWRLANGLESSNRSVENVYVPAGGELVRELSVSVRKPGDYDIVGVLLPNDAPARDAEPFVRYLRVRQGTSEDSPSPFPFDVNAAPPLETQVRRAPALPLAANTAKYFGQATYHDDVTGVKTPIREATVQLAEQRRQGAVLVEEILATVSTDALGRYEFPEVSGVGANEETLTLRINLLLQNSYVAVTDGRRTLYRRSTAWGPASLGEATEMNISWEFGNDRRAVGHIFNTMLDERDFLRREVSFERGVIRVEFPSEDDGTYYLVNSRNNNVSDEVIRIAFSDGFYRPALLHEYGHSVMTAAYGNRFDRLPFGEHEGPHSLHTVSDEAFAISEGWAEFLEAVVDDSALNVVSYRNAKTPNVETNKWWTGRADGNGTNRRGEIVEGSVASILWDISDGAQSKDTSPGADDDAVSNEFKRVWTIARERFPKSVLTYRDAWKEKGYPNYDAVLTIFATHGIGVPPNPADVNKDGTVNILDLVLVAQKFGESGPFIAPNPDLNNDGTVDISDLVVVAQAFGTVAAAPSVAASRKEAWTPNIRALPDGNYELSLETPIRGLTMAARVSLSGADIPVTWALAESGGQAWLSESNGRLIVVALGETPKPMRLRMTPTTTVSLKSARLTLADVSLVTDDFRLVPLADSTRPLSGESGKPRLTLLPNYPNPFNPETWIPFQLSESAHVSVTIQDAAGRSVKHFALGELPAGDYVSRDRAVYWDGTNDTGESAASGVYWVRVRGGTSEVVRKVLLSK